MKKLVTSYTFDASAKTVVAADFTSLEKIQLITNVTDNIIIYNFADAAKGGALSGTTLTLDYDTTSMDDADKLQIFVEDGSVSQQVSGDIASAATDSGNPVKIAGKYNTSGSTPTFTDGQRGDVGIGSRGAVKVQLMGVDSTAGLGIATAGADGATNTVNAFKNYTLPSVFNGSTWDRTPGNVTDGALVNLGANNDVTIASLPLPSGASTSAKQDDIVTAIEAIPGGGGTQYTEADTDSSITGTAVMWEDGSDTLRAVSAAKPLPVNGSGVIQPVAGDVASAATDSGNPVKTGGVNRTTQPTLTDGQRGDTQLDTRGNTKITLFDANTSTKIPGIVDNADGVAASATANKLAVQNRNTVFNGTTWDRQLGNATDGTLVNLGTNNDVTVTSGAITDTNSAAIKTAVETIDNIVSGAGANISQVGGTNVDTNSGTKSAGTQRIVLATDQPQLTNALKVDGSATTQPVSGTVTATSGTAANLKAEVTGATSGSGTATGAIRVELPTNGTGVVGLNAGTNAIGKLAANSGVDIGDVDVTSLPSIPAGTNLIGKTSASGETSTIYDGTTAVTPKFAIIDAATSGDNTLVAAVASKKIRVLNLVLISSGTVNVRFESGASGTALTGQMNLVASTGFAPGYSPIGHFETASNTLLNLELSAAVSVDGWLVYIEV